MENADNKAFEIQPDHHQTAFSLEAGRVRDAQVQPNFLEIVVVATGKSN